MRLIGYIRVSRVAGREGDSFISPSVQREKIEAQAKAGGHVLVDVLQDLDQPGSKYERPGFQEALERVERDEADGIIVYALDRFARSVPDAAVALRRLEQANAVLVSVRDSLDTSTPVGRFARTMMLALAEMELDRTRENWAVARDRAIARGVHVAARVPLGYRRTADGRLEPDPETAPVVRQLFENRADGASWRELAALLDERLPRDGAWPISTVVSMLGRRTYLGEAFAGTVTNATAHQPLVSRAEWEAAQSVATPRHRNGGEPALLAGIVTCGGCGQPMTRQGSGAKGPWANYVCRKRSSISGVCSDPAKISTRRADAYVEGAFLDWLQDQRVAVESVALTKDLESAERRLEGAQAELAAYRDTELISVIGREAYVEGLAQRSQAVDEAQDVLIERQRASEAAGLLRVDLADTWPSLSTNERRVVLASAVERVDVQRAARPGKGSPAADRLAIVWRLADTPKPVRLAPAHHR